MITRPGKTKILIVEDELSYRELYEEILSEEYELSFASNSTDGKKTINDFIPDIAVIDMRLQNIRDNTDGLELAEYTHLVNKNIIIILKSGFPFQSDEIQERINKAEIFAVLDKSSDNQVKELLNTIKRAEDEWHKPQTTISIF